MTASAAAAATGKVAKEAADKKAARSGPERTKKAPADASRKKPASAKKAETKTALNDTKPKAPSARIAAADLKPAGVGAAGAKEAPGGASAGTKPATSTGGATPASALPIAYAPAAPAAPARLYDPPAPARLVAPSPPPIEAPPSPTIGSRAKAASAWRIQIAAVASTKAAKKEWRRIAAANEDLLSKLKLDIRRADLGARGVFYRVQAGTLESESEARDVCKALLERKVTCFVVPVK